MTEANLRLRVIDALWPAVVADLIKDDKGSNSSRTMLPVRLKTTGLLCMLLLAGSQGSHVPRRSDHVKTLLFQHCWNIASFLPDMCSAKPLGPACCGLSALVTFCSPSCTGQPVSLEALMYDATVCDALTLTQRAYCLESRRPGRRCRYLRHLVDSMCIPYVRYGNTYPHAHFIHDRNGGVGGRGGDEEERGTTVSPECQGEQNRRYRTIDGSCNNLQNPRWGKSFEPQRRLLPAQLVDGNLPRTRGEDGKPLPSPRVISLSVFPMGNIFADVSNMAMVWGQFLLHDIVLTPVVTGEQDGGKRFICCGDIDEDLKAEKGGPCFTIDLPLDDPLSPRSCMEFVRSLPVTSPNGTLILPREQISAHTSFIDGSGVYGSTQGELDALRGDNGAMRVKGDNMLPEDPSPTARCRKEGEAYCFLTGDRRVNAFMGPGVVHTVFIREHNRIAGTLQHLNPHWDAETVFQETRRILVAEIQHITYKEWLPLLLDDVTLTKYDLHGGDFQYDPNADPTVANVFAGAVFRFAHSQINQYIKIGSVTFPVQDILLRTIFVLRNLTTVAWSLSSTQADKVDRYYADGLTNHLFETNKNSGDGFDLVALNIQRGRDHGLAPFNEWRSFCGLPRLNDLNSPELTANLVGLYDSVDDVDPYVGMMTERHVPGSLVGPTLACLLALQFSDLKRGDRFFYEASSTPWAFTRGQLREIKKVSLAKILCDNIPDLKVIPKNVFTLKESRSYRRCGSLPSIDLRYWKEKKSGYYRN